MGAIRSTINYIKQEEFKITIKRKMIDIENYEKIGKIDENEMIIFGNNLKIVIKGNSLTINKLMNREVLILGNYKQILFEGKDE